MHLKRGINFADGVEAAVRVFAVALADVSYEDENENHKSRGRRVDIERVARAEGDSDNDPNPEDGHGDDTAHRIGDSGANTAEEILLRELYCEFGDILINWFRWLDNYLDQTLVALCLCSLRPLLRLCQHLRALSDLLLLLPSSTLLPVFPFTNSLHIHLPLNPL